MNPSTKTILKTLIVLPVVCTLTLPFWGAEKVYQLTGLNQYAPPMFSVKMASKIPAPWIDANVFNEASSKQKHQFWSKVIDEDRRGVSLRVLETPEVFQMAFPGYPEEMRADQQLWEIYFSQFFANFIYLNGLSKFQTQGIGIYYSFTGCLEIIRRYGVDILILGNSETFRATIPDLLAKKVAEQRSMGLENPRVLHCAAGNMTTKTVQLTAQLIEKNKATDEKIPLIIWGYSFWMANSTGQFLREQTSSHQNQITQYELGESLNKPQELTWSTLLTLRPSHLIGNPSWSLLFDKNIDSANSADMVLDQALIPSQFTSDSSSLAKYLDDNWQEQDNPYLRGSDEKTCQSKQAQIEVNDAASALNTIAHHQLIYLVEATPWLIRRGPECLWRRAKNLIEQLSRGNMLGYTRGFPLEANHFLLSGRNRQGFFVDEKHVNVDGARLMTNELAELIEENFGKD